jgi:hypothetical protein
MRRIIAALVAGLAVLTTVGCGGTTINTAPLTDEQIKKMQEEDQKTFEEEGGKAGKAGAAKPGAKK